MQLSRLLPIVCGLMLACAAYQSGATQSTLPQNTEARVKSALCQVENKNFDGAVMSLEQVLEKESGNIYARRLLPGIKARKVKANDQSAANLEAVRAAIAAYEAAAVDPAFKEQADAINDYSIRLHNLFGADEKYAVLLKKADDTTKSAKLRALYYIALATDKRHCASSISDAAAVKTPNHKAGERISVFRRPPNQSDFDKLKECANTGMELIEKAIALDSQSGKAFIEQSYIYDQLARIAVMERNQTTKDQLTSKFDVALRRGIDLAGKSQTKENSEPRPVEAMENANKTALGKYDSELRTYQIERPLANLVSSLDLPLRLPALDVFGLEELERNDKKSKRVPLKVTKRNNQWRLFTAESGFRAELPDPVAVDSTGSTHTFEAVGDEISFSITEYDLYPVPEEEQDLSLNTAAWAVTEQTGKLYLMGKIRGSRFESELIRKDRFGGRAARFYSYKTINCQDATPGMLIFLTGTKKGYSINVYGAANESDERFQKFWRSLKLG